MQLQRTVGSLLTQELILPVLLRAFYMCASQTPEQRLTTSDENVHLLLLAYLNVFSFHLHLDLIACIV